MIEVWGVVFVYMDIYIFFFPVTFGEEWFKAAWDDFFCKKKTLTKSKGGNLFWGPSWGNSEVGFYEDSPFVWSCKGFHRKGRLDEPSYHLILSRRYGPGFHDRSLICSIGLSRVLEPSVLTLASNTQAKSVSTDGWHTETLVLTSCYQNLIDYTRLVDP